MLRLVIRLLPVILILVSGAPFLEVRGQWTLVPSSSPCVCDGSFTYLSSLTAPFQVQITDADGIELANFISPNSTISYFGLCPSLFTITITANGGGEVQVFSLAGGSINPGTAGSASVCSNAGPTSLSSFIAGFQPGGQWTNPSGGPDNGNFNPQTENPGLYVYTLNSGGCEVSTGVLVSETANSNAGLSTTYLICENYAPFFMTDVLTGNPNAGGTWSFAGGTTMDGWFQPATMNTGLFTYTVPGVPGCDPVVSTLFVIENTIPNPGTNTSILVCQGAAPFSMYSQLGGNPDPGGIWYNQQNQVVNNLFNPAVQPAGIYRYSVDGQTPCTDQESFLTIAFTATNPSGSGGVLNICQSASPVNLFNTLGGNPVPGGTWTNAQGQVVSGTFHPANQSSGTFTYYYPNVGCTPSNAMVSVHVQSVPQAGNDQSVSVCVADGPFLLNSYLSPGATPGGMWTLGGQAALPVYTPTGPGSYTFTYTVTGAPCPTDQSVLQLQLEAPPPSIADVHASLCATSDPVPLSGYYPGVGPLQFADASGTSADTFHPGAPVALPITVTLPSGNSCPPSTAQWVADIEQPSFAPATIPLPVCSSDATVDLTATGFVTDYNAGTWQQDGIEVPPVVPLEFTGQQAFTFTTEPGFSCPSSVLTVLVQVTEAPDAGPDVLATLCITDAAVDVSLLLPGAGSGAGSWFMGEIPLAQSAFDPSIGQDATYRFVVEVSGYCPPDEAQLIIEVDPGITLDLGADVVGCHGDPAQVIGVEPLSGYNYQWTGSGFSGDSQSSEVSFPIQNTGSTPVTTALTLQAGNGVCEAADAITITVHPLPEVEVSGPDSACEGEQITLTAQAGSPILWTGSIPFVNPSASQQTMTTTDTFTYGVEVTSVAGCTNSVSGIVQVFPLPSAEVEALPGEGCQPYTYGLQLGSASTGISTTTWTIDGAFAGTGTSATWTFEEAGWYDLALEVTSPGGCESTLTWDSLVHVLVQPEAGFSYLPETLSLLQPVAEVASSAYQADFLQWFLDGTIISLESLFMLTLPADAAGSYILCQRAVSSDGCADTLCVELEVENSSLFYAPNTFTPDQDGLNEVFRPVYLGYLDNSYHLQVFDRWGVLIFETQDPEEGWTGAVNRGNFFAPDGVYLWQIELRDASLPEYVRYQGHVTLLR